MATAHSSSFLTNKDSLFASVMELVNSSGYVISETDDAAKRLVYVAEKKGFHFDITVTVSGTLQSASGNEEPSALLTVKATSFNTNRMKPVWQSETDTGTENDLVNYIFKKISEIYPRVKKPQGNNQAPGVGETSGCLVMAGLLLGSGLGFSAILIYLMTGLIYGT